MDRKDRHTLKSYFQKGDVPTEEQFAELIDSVPNIVDDGEAVRTEDGWASIPGKEGRWVSACTKRRANPPHGS